MRQDLGKKAIAYPMPVLIIGTYDEDGHPDAMNAAWGGIGDDTQFFCCLSPNHKTVKNILKTKAFTVSFGIEEYAAECDYLGIVSGNDVPNKLEKCGLHTEKSKYVNAPIITELPLTVECSLISYEPEHCHLFGEIENVSIDESILSEGKVDLSKFKPITFDTSNLAYVGLGEKIADAFKAGKQFK